MHRTDENVARQTADDGWDSAIPMPRMPEQWWQRRFRCQCGKKFETTAEYRAHYIGAADSWTTAAREHPRVESAPRPAKIMHLPAPGPDYWNWRCLICDEEVGRHASVFLIVWTKLRRAIARAKS